MTSSPDADPDLSDLDLDEPGRRVLKVVGGAVAALAAIAVIVVLAALTLSVQVDGKSMDPTLRQGDRLIADVFDRSDVQRFDLVGAKVPDVGVVVKRVIGMPGDTVEIREAKGVPVVVVRPEGSSLDQVVVNPAWTDRIAGDTAACCAPEGKTSASPTRITVPAGHYWVIGDNWGASDDSRVFGFVAADQIGASLNFRIMPISDFGRVAHDVTLRPVG